MATPYVEFSSKSPIKSQKREIEKFKLCSTGCHAKLTCGARDNVRACVRACVRASCARLDLYVLSSEVEDSMKACIRFMRRFAFKGATSL